MGISGTSTHEYHGRRIALLIAIAVLAMPAIGYASTQVEEVLKLHQSWLDNTDNFFAEVAVVSVGEDADRLVAEGLLLFDHQTGDHSLSLSQSGVAPKGLIVCDDFAIQTESRGDLKRTAITGFGSSELTLPPGPFQGVTYDLFTRGSTVAETAQRLRTIASDVRAEEGSGSLAGAVGLALRFDQDFKRESSTLVDKLLGGPALLPDEAWSGPQQIKLWFDTQDGRLLQVSSTADGAIYDILFNYSAVDMSTAELASAKDSFAIETPSFLSFRELLETYLGPRQLTKPMTAGMPIIALMMLLLAGRAIGRSTRRGILAQEIDE